MSITQDQFNVLLSRIEILEDEIKKLKSKQIPKTKLKKERSLRHTDKEFDTYIKEYIHNILIQLFHNWTEKHQSRIDHDDTFYESIYVPRLHKIMNCKARPHELQKWLYYELRI